MTKPSFMVVVVNKLVAVFDGGAMHSAGASFAEFFPHLWAIYTPQGGTCPENPNTNLQSSLIPAISSRVVQRFWA